MKSKIYAYMFTLGGIAVLLTGCGGGGTTPDKTGHALTESLTCIGCHEDSSQNPKWVSPGTGKSIVAEWKASTHNTNNGASCTDCHGSDFGNPVLHPSSCSKCHTVGGQILADSSVNPDRHGRCALCHAKTNPRPGTFDGFDAFTYEDPAIPALPAGSTTRFIHFSTGKRANFVSTNYINNCRKCHNPHDTSSGKAQRQEWAQSGHGATTTNARASYDFKTMGSDLTSDIAYGSTCVRCHTSTGPIKFITSGFMDIKRLPLPTSDTSREVTACNVCHDDGSGYAYGYKIRTVGPVTTYYNFSASKAPSGHISVPKTFPDIASSNICLVCHVGREIGETIKTAAIQGVDFTKVLFMSSHYLTAGASLFQISGYEFAGRTYPSGGALPYQHQTVGAGAQGPCVTCHMKPGRHTFLPVTLDNNATRWLRQITGIASPECAKCHNGTTAPNIDISRLNASKNGFFQALEQLRLKMQARGMYYGRGGIKTTTALSTNVTNWEKFGIGSGPDTMGAAFNYVLLNFDYGAYAHNSYYAKRLLYDSIDLLDDGILNYTTCAAISVNPAAYQYLCNSTSTSTSADRP